MQGICKMSSENLRKNDLDNFIDKYYSLNNKHQQIVFETLRRMQRSHKHNIVNYTIYELIKTQQEKLDIKYSKLYKLLNQSLNGTVTPKTYESYMRRKSIEGDILPAICKILEIPPSEIDNIKKSISIQSSDATSIKWLYNSLSECNKSAMYYLAHALFMSEHYPEVFDDELFNSNDVY